MRVPAPDPAQVGARIQRARLDLGLTQEDLAHQASFGARALGTWEQGRRVPYRHINELAELLGRSREWLLYGTVTDDAHDARLARLEQMVLETRAWVAALQAEAEQHRRRDADAHDESQ